MGKGDKKTKKGKITMGTFGVSRPKKKRKPATTVKNASKKSKPKAKSKPKPKAKKKEAS